MIRPIGTFQIPIGHNPIGLIFGYPLLVPIIMAGDDANAGGGSPFPLGGHFFLSILS